VIFSRIDLTQNFCSVPKLTFNFHVLSKILQIFFRLQVIKNIDARTYKIFYGVTTNIKLSKIDGVTAINKT